MLNMEQELLRKSALNYRHILIAGCPFLFHIWGGLLI